MKSFDSRGANENMLEKIRKGTEAKKTLGLTLAALLLAQGAGRAEAQTEAMSDTRSEVNASQEELEKACEGVVSRLEEKGNEVHVYCYDQLAPGQVDLSQMAVQGRDVLGDVARQQQYGGRNYQHAGADKIANKQFGNEVGDLVEDATAEHSAFGIDTNMAVKNISVDSVGHTSAEDQNNGDKENKKLSGRRAMEAVNETTRVFDGYGIDERKINMSARGEGSEGDVTDLADKFDIAPGSRRVRIEKAQGILRLFHDGKIEQALNKIGRKSSVKTADQLQQAEDEILAVHRVSDVKIKIGTKDVIVHVGKNPEKAKKFIKFLQDHYLPANNSGLKGGRIPQERAPRVIKATGENRNFGRIAVKQKGVSASPGSFRKGA